jgi:uncharacterized membrane protein SpoIIM required for sporulation/uncharacterized RDD family membrane protein YckC
VPAATHDDDALFDDARSARLWTLERVPIVVPLAGIGERTLAYLVDVALLLAIGLAALLAYSAKSDLEQDFGALSRGAKVGVAVALFAAAVSYDVFCEVAFGRTLGKRLLKLRVVTSTGQPPSLLVALLRNVLRLVDLLPVGYAVGVVTLFVTQTRRLGDLVADTFVVSERAPADLFAACRRTFTGPLPPRRPWTDAQQLLALAGVARAEGLDPHVAATVSTRLLRHIDAELATRADPGPDGAGDDARALLAAQCLAQASHDGVLGRMRHVAEAEATLRSAMAAWSSPAHGGAGHDPVEEAVERLERALRHASSTLVRAARRGVPARARAGLSLAVLDAERRCAPPRPPAARAVAGLSRGLATVVFEERATIARAGAVLAIGLFVGGAVAYADGVVARTLVGDQLAVHIEHGAAWTDRIEQEGAFASASGEIIVNNVFVGLRVFVFGLLGGVGTLLGLLSNGVQLGAVLGYALRLDTASTLLRFVAAHGPVEMTMIAVAGAGGLCLGRALLAPGPRTRLRALREEGSRGVRLVTTASLGFAGIGLVEGFLSPGRLFPVGVNVVVGLSLAALFWAWAATGASSSPSATSPAGSKR